MGCSCRKHQSEVILGLIYSLVGGMSRREREARYHFASKLGVFNMLPYAPKHG